MAPVRRTPVPRVGPWPTRPIFLIAFLLLAANRSGGFYSRATVSPRVSKCRICERGLRIAPPPAATIDGASRRRYIRRPFRPQNRIISGPSSSEAGYGRRFFRQDYGRGRTDMRASDIRRGQAVIIDSKLFVVTNADHNTPGNLRAKVQFKLRDVSKGTILDKRVGATDDIQTATLDRRQVEYLYSDNDGHVLMDLETYDQNTIPKEVFGNDILYLKPNTQLMALFHDGKVVSYELPKTVDLKEI